MRLRHFILSEKGSMHISESLALRAVSLLLALILWITILGFKREEIKKNVKLEPLLPPGMVITSKIPPYIQFTLSGPRVWLKDAEKRIQPIRPDLRRTHENTIGLTISEDLIGELPVGVRVTNFFPTQIIIRLEDVVERYLPIKPSLHGSPAVGYEISAAVALPSKVPVSGPKSSLSTLEWLGTEPIDIQDFKGTKEIEVAVDVDATQGFQLSREKTVKVKLTTKKVRSQ